MVERAAARTAEYEAAMRAARAEVYQVQEQLHQKLEEDRKAEVAAARASAEDSLRKFRATLAGDVELAKKDLGSESDMLAAEITKVILSRSAA